MKFLSVRIRISEFTGSFLSIRFLYSHMHFFVKDLQFVFLPWLDRKMGWIGFQLEGLGVD